jgi:hypothetical protein
LAHEMMRDLSPDETQVVIAYIRQRIPKLPKVGDLSRWEKGWSENLKDFRGSGDVADLRPKYIRPNQPIRYNGRFVEPAADDAEMLWYEDFRASLAKQWLINRPEVWEFGSGSGHNLAYLKTVMPEARLVGLDWSWAAVEIADEIGEGRRFDFYNPVIPDFHDRAVILTVGALEQTGLRKWVPFMEDLLLARPSLCVHVEPIVEWYDPGNPVDATAIAVHEAKGFWVGFWDWLRARRREGKIRIREARRTGFGSLMVEGYSVIVWEPV